MAQIWKCLGGFLTKGNQRRPAFKYSNPQRRPAFKYSNPPLSESISLKDVVLFCKQWNYIRIRAIFSHKRSTLTCNWRSKRLNTECRHTTTSFHFLEHTTTLPAFRILLLTRRHDSTLVNKNNNNSTSIEVACMCASLTRWDAQSRRWDSAQTCPWSGEIGSHQTLVQWSAGMCVHMKKGTTAKFSPPPKKVLLRFINSLMV